MDNIILIGAGGHCKSCIDVIEMQGSYKIIGLIDSNEKIGDKILGYSIIGKDKDLAKLKKKVKNVLITIGQIKSSKARIRIYKHLKKEKFIFPIIISPLAYVSKHSSIKEGTILHHYSTINASAEIGYNTIINNRSLIEHDVKIGNHCHVSTGAIVNGGAKIGDQTFVGSNATIREGIKIGKNCIIGMGKVVTKNCKDRQIIL